MEKMTGPEWDRFERRWKAVFSVFGGVLALCLIEVLAFAPERGLAMMCYGIGGLAAVGAWYAASELRDIDRQQSVANAVWLSEVEAPASLEALNLDD